MIKLPHRSLSSFRLRTEAQRKEWTPDEWARHAPLATVYPCTRRQLATKKFGLDTNPGRAFRPSCPLRVQPTAAELDGFFLGARLGRGRQGPARLPSAR